MIELNWTFFVQIFNFLLLIFILNKILYKPILKVLDEREERIAGGQEKAKKLLEESQSILKSYNEKLYNAKIDAMTVKNSSRKQAVDEANEIIENARRNAEEIVLSVQKEMAEEIARVKSELEPEIGVMAGTIAQRILGRKVA
ncbi:MAG: F0F1 ATP synthase subunit B [Desulfomonilia bacterium]|uniref:ATP synthase subunit b n=1 Tax=anaerobic digester metagenome TaxID=1263854 RepID=A0A485LYH7_9ZZZZ|nr:F0F1 ATP synthase subunit B [Pseudomonadota bacterium]HON38157.1 F0F1 ATP synthase subunit B [Deltaproteobacteria bacterium]HRS56406.1 F0F1 ATP synthase subunit B [Desulfomonilia bacterium]HPD21476.1 F0F1 ATP synthase subunit B [Deltaproteobacteria bacterium]HPX18065.1 F0F1 ATP synthase subunit B [Deltaproteobacteria bacterium]